MEFRPNEGDRLSKLAIARRAVGEVAGDVPPEAAAELADAARKVRPFDAAAIRARAQVAPAPPANNTRWYAGLAAVAAAFLGVFLVATPDAPVIGVRGGQRLALYTLDGDRLAAWDGGALHAGDVVGVRVRPGDSEGVVVLSVDGTGTATVFWPAPGAGMETVPSGGWTELPGTVTLDGAPGPEVFVAVFDLPADEVEDAAAAAWKQGGAEGVRTWGDAAGDAIVVDRR
jgi:hypothetical protein